MPIERFECIGTGLDDLKVVENANKHDMQAIYSIGVLPEPCSVEHIKNKAP